MNRPFIPRIKNADATYDSFPDWQASEGEGLGGAPGADEIYKVTAAVIPDGLHLQWMCNCGGPIDVVINSADVQSAVTGGMNAGYVQQDQNAVRLMQHFKGIAAQQGRR